MSDARQGSGWWQASEGEWYPPQPEAPPPPQQRPLQPAAADQQIAPATPTSRRLSDSGDPDPDLGVLVVHGIGSHRQGQTLVRWGDAIADWIDKWTASARRRQAETDQVGGATVAEDAPAPAEDDAGARFERVHLRGANDPACGTLTFGEPGETSRWLLAEAWWEGAFAEPTYGALAAWSIRALPVTLYTHALDSYRRVRAGPNAAKASLLRRLPQITRKAAWVVVILLIIVLAPVIVLALLALLVIGLVPIPQVRSFVISVQRALTGSVGDSLVLVESPTQRGAMTERVASGLRFLRSRGCAKVVVVAHSQGAAIAHMAVADPRSDERVDTLVTVGSGIKKLFDVRGVSEKGWGATWVPSGVMALVLLLGLAIRARVVSGEFDLVQVLIGIAAFFIGYFLVLAIVAWVAPSTEGTTRTAIQAAGVVILVIFTGLLGQWFGAEASLLGAVLVSALVMGFLALLYWLRPAERESGLERPDQVGRWVDLYARYDPVPNGETISADPPEQESIEVFNLDSVLNDHGAYDRNRDGCLSRIIAEMDETSSRPSLAIDHDVVDEAASHRLWRLWWLRGTRWIIAVAGAVFLLRVGVDNVDNWVRAELPFDLPDAPDAVVAFAAVTTGCVIINYLISLVWRRWDSVDTAGMFSGRPRSASGSTFVPVFLGLWALIIAIGLRGDVLAAELLGSDEAVEDRVFGLITNAGIFFVLGYVASSYWKRGARLGERLYRRITGLSAIDWGK